MAMVRLTDRQRRILVELSHACAVVTGDMLSSSLGCSKRTIQAEVSHINAVFGRRVITSTNRGYQLDPSAGEDLIDGITTQGDDATNYEHALVRELLFGQSAPTVGDLALSLYGSQSSIERALISAKTLLQRYGLSLNKTNGRLSVSGTPENRKKLVRDMVLQEARDAYSSGYSILSKDLDVEFVSDTLKRAAGEKDAHIEPGYLDELSVNIAITLWQFRSHGALLLEANSLEGETIERQVASIVCQAYEKRWDLQASLSLERVIAAHLKGFVRLDKSRGQTDKLREAGFLDEVAGIIAPAFESYGLPPIRVERLRPISMHIKELLARSPEGQLRGSGIADDIRSSYPFVYEVSLLVAHGISEHFGIKLNTGELGLICVHVGFLIGVEYKSDLQIVVVAGPYQATAAMIRDRLVGRFENRTAVHITDTIDDAIGLKPDLLVTTELTSALPERTVRVSPLFGDRDLERVERRYLEIRRHRELSRRSAIRQYIEDPLFIHDDGTERLDKKQTIKLLSDALKDQHIVSSSFPESVLAREEAASTCFCGKFALPHATTMDAHRTAICTLVSKPGVNWDGTVIHIVMMIAVCESDRSQFVNIFDDLARYLMDERSLQKLIQSTSAEEFREALSSTAL